MNTPAKYFIVEADAMPEIFRKVAEAAGTRVPLDIMEKYIGH